jgi:hypothetical protein
MKDHGQFRPGPVGPAEKPRGRKRRGHATRRVPGPRLRSPPVHLAQPRLFHPGGVCPLILPASNQSAGRDRATLEHAAAEAEDADRKDAEILARLTRIETTMAEVAAFKR